MIMIIARNYNINTNADVDLDSASCLRDFACNAEGHTDRRPRRCALG